MLANAHWLLCLSTILIVHFSTTVDWNGVALDLDGANMQPELDRHISWRGASIADVTQIYPTYGLLGQWAH